MCVYVVLLALRDGVMSPSSASMLLRLLNADGDFGPIKRLKKALVQGVN